MFVRCLQVMGQTKWKNEMLLMTGMIKRIKYWIIIITIIVIIVIIIIIIIITTTL